jgi:Mn2+/Fe2+ NRAMP family transporter
VIGGLLNVSPLDPVKALFWSAVINGVVAVPIMVMIMLLGGRKDVMGDFRLSLPLRTVGWLATGVMGIAAVGMFATMGG